MNKKIISVIVPIYNTEKYLRRCILSILNQTFVDFELILVDDGSTDKCGEICDEFMKCDERVRVIHQTNQGVAKARNVGIECSFENSNSEWICFIDSDDWVSPNYLKILMSALEVTNCKICVTDPFKTNDNCHQKTCEVFNEFSIVSPREIYMKGTITSCVPTGKLYSKVLFENIRYPVGKIHEDEYVTYKILFLEKKVVSVPGAIYILSTLRKYYRCFVEFGETG